MKICSKCGESKELKEFYKDNRKKGRHLAKCKICTIIYSKKYYNKELKKEYDSIYREKNSEIIKFNRRVNLPKTREKVKKRRKEDPLFALSKDLRSRLCEVVRLNRLTKRSKFYKYLGCSIEKLKSYIESQFEPWMTWENRGIYNKDKPTWNIDHIIPLSIAKTEEELYKLCHYTNLRPLLALDNIKKSNKIC